MLRMYFQQLWYSLSEYDSRAMKEFRG